MRRYAAALVVFVIMSTWVAGCGIGKRQGAQSLQPPPGMAEGMKAQQEAAQGELHVFVPCGIMGPYGQILKLFEAKYPNIKVRQDLANIDVQTNLIVDGKAAPDVWLALGDREMKRALEAGKVDGEPITWAYNSLAFIVQKDNPCHIEDVKDLAKADVKTIAAPTEENSSGYYVLAALKKAGVDRQVEGKLWLTPEPAKVKTQVASGKADVGVVYYPCAREARIMGGEPQELKGKAQLLGKLPAELSGPIPAQAAIIKGAKNPQAGRLFLDFLLTDEAQDIWENWAFDRAKQPASGKRVVLYMYCGSAIRPITDKAVELFKKQRPDIRVDVGYAGSGCLLGQLNFARRGDLYMPGETFYLDQAKQRGHVVSDRLVGYFEPVLLVQKGNPKHIKTLADLARAGISVGLGEPDACAVGRAAEQMLKDAGLSDQVLPNVKVRANNVNELANYVKLKSLDVTIVWNLMAAHVDKDCEIIKIPRELYKPSPIPVALLKYSQHPEEAQAFIDLLTGPEGQRIVADFGMTPASSGGNGR